MRMHHALGAAALLLPLLGMIVGGGSAAAPEQAAGAAGPVRVPVQKALITHDDGDTLTIRWPDAGAETVRILGIDTPEVLHLDHEIPFPQPFGYEAAGFLEGCVATADKVELLRSGQKDPFGRTLGYLFVNGRNYSVLVLGARLAVESVTRYGDNGLPAEAQACLAAAKGAGPAPFEDPHVYRARMREVARWMKAHGTYPGQSGQK
jgi:endonuclease YncB( thermonuclease family)